MCMDTYHGRIGKICEKLDEATGRFQTEEAPGLDIKGGNGIAFAKLFTVMVIKVVTGINMDPCEDLFLGKLVKSDMVAEWMLTSAKHIVIRLGFTRPEDKDFGEKQLHYAVLQMIFYCFKNGLAEKPNTAIILREAWGVEVKDKCVKAYEKAGIAMPDNVGELFN